VKKAKAGMEKKERTGEFSSIPSLSGFRFLEMTRESKSKRVKMQPLRTCGNNCVSQTIRTSNLQGKKTRKIYLLALSPDNSSKYYNPFQPTKKKEGGGHTYPPFLVLQPKSKLITLLEIIRFSYGVRALWKVASSVSVTAVVLGGRTRP